MIKHIVFFKFLDHAEGADKAANLAKAKQMLDACVDLVPGMTLMEIALAQPGFDCTYDLVVNSAFENAAALDAYQNHPIHVAAKQFLGKVKQERQCMDYTA